MTIILSYALDGRFFLKDSNELEKQFIQEYKNKNLAKHYVKILKENKVFQNALSELRNDKKAKIYTVGNKKYRIYKPNYYKFFNTLLRMNNNPYASYLAVNLIMVAYGTYNDEVNNKYLLPFSKVLYLNKMCLGYLFYGDMQRIKKNYSLARQIYIEGKSNCSIPFLRTQIIGRKLKYF
jgi:hypothetical protein